MPLLDRSVYAPDGTKIAYSVAGTGPAVMLTNGLTTTTYFWRHVRRILLDRHTVIAWDYAGHGASDPASGASSAEIAGQPSIMARIMDAAGIERAAHIGWSVGCQVVLEMLRQHPERFTAAGLLFGPSEHALTHTALAIPGAQIAALLHHPDAPRLFELLQHCTQVVNLPGWPSLLRLHRLISHRTQPEDLDEILRLFRLGDPVTMCRLACSAEAHSAREVLAEARIPLLIMGGGKDPFAPLHTVAEVMHRRAADSELVTLPEATHTALLDQPEEVAAAIERFLARRTSAPRAS